MSPPIGILRDSLKWREHKALLPVQVQLQQSCTPSASRAFRALTSHMARGGRKAAAAVAAAPLVKDPARYKVTSYESPGAANTQSQA